ncbi:hypothetical protein E2562_033294 [Oryza meyeriana var. granulata]|uniref:DUF3615 domain-containing protein n=1 Tax=Oryza meyeriana var. granulata TaxID=110450 RepID=A0A6G1F0V8_9ORYZ|nr:hypothetical protein E2562_033294 [Oryza meyeriana var. granulata]
MDGDAGGDPATGAGDVPFAGRYLPSRRRPGRRGAQFLPREESVDERLGRRHPELFDQLDLIRPGQTLTSHVTGRRGGAAARARTLIRQSVLYSDCPKRSRGRRGQVKSQIESQAEKDASEVSSSELGATTTDMPKFKTLSLNDSPSAPDSTDRAAVHTGSMDSDLPDSATAELPATEEVLSPRSESIRKINLYLAEHTFDDLMEGFEAMLNGFRDPPKDASQPNAAELTESSKPRELDAQSSQKPRQTFEVSESLSSAAEDVAQHKVSTEEIIQNGKRWMSEEVMLAFKKYVEGRNEFRDVVYELDELQHQCFSVDAYQKVFHHYNFTVKMKKPTSEGWSLMRYFAEMKQIYGEKVYLCCPLKPHDNGYCHACVNQGMDALKHPANDEVGFEIGHFNTGFPFMYLSDDVSDDESVESVPWEMDAMEIFDSVFS